MMMDNSINLDNSGSSSSLKKSSLDTKSETNENSSEFITTTDDDVNNNDHNNSSFSRDISRDAFIRRRNFNKRMRSQSTRSLASNTSSGHRRSSLIGLGEQPAGCLGLEDGLFGGGGGGGASSPFGSGSSGYFSSASGGGAGAAASGHLMEPEVQVVQSSKKLAEQERIEQLTSNRIRGLQAGTLYGREQEIADLRACLDKLVGDHNNNHNNNPLQIISGEGQQQDEEAKFMGTPEQPPSTAPTATASLIIKQEQQQSRKAATTAKAGRRSLILLKGYSGSGKTALASTLKGPVTNKQYNGIFVTGKFDLYLRDAQPYFGIAAACDEICKAIALLGGQAHEELQLQLMEKLGSSDIRLLKNVIPEITKLIPNAAAAAEADLGDHSGSNLDMISLSSSVPTNTRLGDFSETGSRGGASRVGSIRTTGGKRISSYSGGGTGGAGSGGCHGSRAKAKLHYVFRVLMRLITSYYSPLCIVLDDLQWADPASLDLVQTLLTDRKNDKFMVIGLYRSNEVDNCHILRKWIFGLRDTARHCDNNLDLLEREVGNLGVDAVKSISMDLLSIDDDQSTQELAELCHKRTQGNIFFLIAFIAMLQEEGFLTYDLHKGRYTWNIEDIKAETGAASNMVDLMNNKMAKLPEDHGLLLSLAACLGATFDLAKLEVAWKQFAKERLFLENEEDTLSLQQRLSRAVQEGFLETLDETASQYRWIHDRVQEAALTLIPEEEWSNFKFHLGDILRENLSDDAIDASIFLIVNLLNDAPVDSLDELQCLQVAQLNLEATEKAVSFSAFSSAAKYAGRGIELLPAGSWYKDYWLTLELYSFAAEAEEFNGNNQTMKSYCDEILNQSSEVCPLIDKLRVYNVLVSSMANLGDHVQAVALALKVLAELKVKFPKSSLAIYISTVAGLMKSKSTTRSRTPAEIARLPFMEDMLDIERMKMLDKLLTSAYLSGNGTFSALVAMKSIKLTLQNGLCDFSPPAFGANALVITGIMNDPIIGSNIGEYALLLLEKLQSRTNLSRTKFIVQFFVFSWTKPIPNCFAPLLEGYEDGLASGDTESAMWAVFAFVILSFMSGQSLKQVASDCSNYTEQMKELKRQPAYDFTVTAWQAALNLMGLSGSTTKLEGDVLLSEKDFLSSHQDNPPCLAISRAQQLRLYATFREFEEGANLFIATGYDFPEVAVAHPLFMSTVFCGGLCCGAAARNTNRKRYKKYARKARKTLKGWVRKGNPNVKHSLALLNAEIAAQGKKHKDAEKYYQSAITLAARHGFTNDCALANERYGEFMLSLSDSDGAKYYLENAIKYYSEWGAMKKVELLKELHSDLL